MKGEGVLQSKSAFKRENVNFEVPAKFNLLRT